MKKAIFLALILCLSLLFSDETTIFSYPKKKDISYFEKLEELFSDNTRFFYFRFSSSQADVSNPLYVPLIGGGVGARVFVNRGAIDVSMNIQKGRKQFILTLPRASYLHYLNPEGDRSLYFGGGLALGCLVNRTTKLAGAEFVGVIANGSLGYEFSHGVPVLSFAEFTISQPVIALASILGAPFTLNLLRPHFEFSTGVGF